MRPGPLRMNEFQRFAGWMAHLPSDIWNRIEAGKLKPKGNVIVFNSSGGLVLEAMEMGGVIEGYHFGTGVSGGGQCSSACVLAWAAAVAKSAAADSYLGVHNASLTGVAGHTATDRLSSLPVTGKMGQWLQLHGAPYNVITQMLDTPSDSLYQLTPEDLAAWHVTVVGEPANATPAAPPVGDVRQNFCTHLEHEFDAQTTIMGKTKPLSRAYDEALLRADVAGHILLDQNCPLPSRNLMQNFLDQALAFEHGPMAQSMVR